MFSFQAPLTDPTTSFKGRNVIVTGANTGLGLEAAVKFAALDASKIVIGVRDQAKGERAKEIIENRTGTKGRVEVWHLDMDSYESIQEFSQRASELEHLDIAILNAGVYMVDYQRSEYGWEQTLQINVISTALLGILLLPKLRSSNMGRDLPVLEFVSSSNYKKAFTSPKQKDLQSLLQAYNTAEGYNASQQYAASKFFVMCIMQKLAEFANRSDGRPDVVVTSVCPGYCQSDLSRGHNTLIMNVLRFIANTLFLRTTEGGARTLVHGCSSDEEAHGGFWKDNELESLTSLLAGEEGKVVQEKVWADVIEVLKDNVPRVEEMIKAASQDSNELLS